jgi:GT2 family glycosyltransferase
MRVSVVVPVHGNAALTAQCLARLGDAMERQTDTEVVVVDDASPDNTRAVVEAAGRVRLIEHAEPRGFAASCNDGAAAATGEYVIFLNNDVFGRGDWLDQLVSYAYLRPKAAAVGAKLLYPNETIQHAGIVICQDLLPRHVYRGFAANHAAVTRSRPFQAVTGACVLVRRRLFEDVGGFDETFANGFEDVDLCLRLGSMGHEIHYCAESVLIHLEAATRGDDDTGFRRNAELYLAKWRNSVRPDDFATYVEDGFLFLEPGDVYPLRLVVSPELAVVDTDEVETFKLLGIRSRQVFDLLKENTLLRLRVARGGPPAMDVFAQAIESREEETPAS